MKRADLDERQTTMARLAPITANMLTKNLIPHPTGGIVDRDSMLAFVKLGRTFTFRPSQTTKGRMISVCYSKTTINPMGKAYEEIAGIVNNHSTRDTLMNTRTVERCASRLRMWLGEVALDIQAKLPEGSAWRTARRMAGEVVRGARKEVK